MQQADSLLRLIQCLHQQAPELSFGMFSGYAEYELDQGQYWIWGDGSSEQHRRPLWQEIRGASSSLSSGVSIRLSQAVSRCAHL
jgi:hypothetical protein